MSACQLARKDECKRSLKGGFEASRLSTEANSVVRCDTGRFSPTTAMPRSAPIREST